jgi:arginase
VNAATAATSARAGDRGAPGVALVGVPFSSAGRPGGIATAIEVLRAGGLCERLAAAAVVQDLGDLAPVAPTAQRGASGLLDERSLTVLVRETRRAVTTARHRGLRPLLVGGDCAVLLGALSALRAQHGRVGLVMADGHEDNWPPKASPTGEASDSELGIALGLVSNVPDDLDDVRGVLHPAAAALLGPRDRQELQAAGIPSLLSTLGAFVDADHVPDHPAALVRRVVDSLDAPVWWLHVDLDVLCAEDFPAVDYQQPGGLTWDQLTELAVTAWRSPACAGASIAIYNPDLDPHRSSARRLTDFLCDLVASRSDLGSDGEA